jgi:hypothetical protein
MNQESPMGFFDTLRRVLTNDRRHPAGATDEGRHGRGHDRDQPLPEAGTPGAYDLLQWQKKLKRILDELPGSQSQWADLMAEERAMGFDPQWVRRCQLEEFHLLVRRAVSDRHFTEAEHRKLDLARDLIGIPELEAEAILHAIVAEAEAFFGKPVEGS